MIFHCACGRYSGPIAWECSRCDEHVVMPVLHCSCGMNFADNRQVVIPTTALCAECRDEFDLTVPNRRYCDQHTRYWRAS